MPLKNTTLWLAALTLSVALGAQPVHAITADQLGQIQRFIEARDYAGLRNFVLSNPNVVDDIRAISSVVADELDAFLEQGIAPSEAVLKSVMELSEEAFAEVGLWETISNISDLTAAPPEDNLY